MKWQTITLLLIISLPFLTLLITQVSADISYTAGTYPFTYPLYTNTAMGFDSDMTFKKCERIDSFWYFNTSTVTDLYGFKIQGNTATLTVTGFFESANALDFHMDTTYTTTVTIYIPSKGQPSSLHGNVTSWYYNAVDKQLIINFATSKSVDINVHWNEVSDTTPPTYTSVSHNTTLTTQVCKFSSAWYDNVAISGYIFAYNGTGSWANETWTAFTTQWANKTKTLPAAGTKVAYHWYANDTSDNWNTTGTYTFTVTSLGQPTVILLGTPADEATVTEADQAFTYTPIYYADIENATLWMNISGTWQVAEWRPGYQVTNNTANTIPYSFSTSATYIWNIAIYNTTTATFAEANRTLYVNLAATPIITTSYNETYYFRSDEKTTNTVTAFGLETTNTNSYVELSDTAAGNLSVELGFRLWIVHSSGTLAELTSGTPRSLVILTDDDSGFQTAYYLITQTSLTLGYDALELTLFMRLGTNPWVAKASYVTDTIMSKRLMAQTWIFKIWMSKTTTSSTIGAFRFGSYAYNSRIQNVGFKTPLVQEIQAYYLSQGDIINWLLYGYTTLFTEAIFYGLMLFIGGATMYIRYRNFGPVLLIFILFGGVGGVVWAFVPTPATFIVWIFLLVGLAALIFRVIR